MDRIEGLTPLSFPKGTENVSAAKAGERFSNLLGEAMEKVNETQIRSDEAAENFIQGKSTDLHNVMIAAEKASITLTAAVEIRDKVIDAYQKIMRMQV
ncbi:MAG TPA: flagellar hook-basal body complex protein FliE [Bacillales bacterium]|nr:flagellar hook-basal body complex protein FliE [Bacillales bacterium]